MHPHLANEKRIHCGALIKALDECHAKGYMNKVLGNCNGIKEELNMCLREERLLRTAKNREKGRERRAQTERIWKAIDEES